MFVKISIDELEEFNCWAIKFFYFFEIVQVSFSFHLRNGDATMGSL